MSVDERWVVTFDGEAGDSLARAIGFAFAGGYVVRLDLAGAEPFDAELGLDGGGRFAARAWDEDQAKGVGPWWPLDLDQVERLHIY